MNEGGTKDYREKKTYSTQAGKKHVSKRGNRRSTGKNLTPNRKTKNWKREPKNPGIDPFGGSSRKKKKESQKK